MIYFAIWNLAVFVIYGIDKFLARKRMRRISEKTLVLLSFALGGIGAIFGMVMFNHKTSKMKFRLLIPLSIFFNAAILFAIRYYI